MERDASRSKQSTTCRLEDIGHSTSDGSEHAGPIAVFGDCKCCTGSVSEQFRNFEQYARGGRIDSLSRYGAAR
jgi:hypothetical protein